MFWGTKGVTKCGCSLVEQLHEATFKTIVLTVVFGFDALAAVKQRLVWT